MGRDRSYKKNGFEAIARDLYPNRPRLNPPICGAIEVEATGDGV
jgi:hypothetical protein